MIGLDLLTSGFSLLIQPGNFLLVLLGTFIGIVFGVIPGLTGTICLVMLLPLTYAMQPVEALMLMGAVYCGAVFGGAISAITLNIPGTPEAICTTFDGYPMARKGLAGKAIGSAVEVSALGGFMSVVVLLFLGPLVAGWALAFSSTEYFSLILMGLCVVSSITGKSLTKGFLSMFLGVLAGTIGMTPITGVTRYTFGSLYLMGRLEFIPIVIGIFAISEFFVRFEEQEELTGGYQARSEWVGLRELWGLKRTIALSGILGYICGAIPGLGATLASFLGYGTARSISRQGGKFGTGVLEGVVAPETANNAATGGAMLPLLTMGIPGGTATAIMLGVLLLHGIEPGPKVFQAHPELLGGATSSMLVANILMLFMGFYFTKVFVGILKIKWGYLIVVILTFCFIGAYSMRANFFDTFTMMAFGVLGYGMRKKGYPLAPLILGVILGHLLEEQFLRTMLRTDNSFFPFIARPISLGFLIFASIILVYPLLGRGKLTIGTSEEGETFDKREFVSLWVLMGICSYAFVEAFNYREPGQAILNSGALWPWISSGNLILLSLIRLTQLMRVRRAKADVSRPSKNAIQKKRAFIGGLWLIGFVAAEWIIGHMFASLIVLPFLIRFSGVTNKKLVWGVPAALMVFTTVLFTVWFYVALPKGMGIFFDVQSAVLFQVETLLR